MNKISKFHARTHARTQTHAYVAKYYNVRIKHNDIKILDMPQNTK